MIYYEWGVSVLIIKSGSVILRSIEREDLKFLQEMMNDPEIEQMVFKGCFPISYDRQVRWFENYDQQKDMRCMIQIQGGATIGMIMLTNIDWQYRTAELSHKTKANSSDRRPGDMMDAMMGMLNYAFNELNLHCVCGTVLEYNMLSRKLALKCGFQEEGILRERAFKNGKYHNLVANSVLKDDFIPIYQSYKENLRNGKRQTV